MILATIRMTFNKKLVNDALSILKAISIQSRAQSGCLSSRVYRNGQMDNVLMFEQLWSDEEKMEGHLRSDEYRQVLLVLEMAVSRPEIRFHTITSSAGIETIEKARANQGRWERA